MLIVQGQRYKYTNNNQLGYFSSPLLLISRHPHKPKNITTATVPAEIRPHHSSPPYTATIKRNTVISSSRSTTTRAQKFHPLSICFMPTPTASPHHFLSSHMYGFLKEKVGKWVLTSELTRSRVKLVAILVISSFIESGLMFSLNNNDDKMKWVSIC